MACSPRNLPAGFDPYRRLLAAVVVQAHRDARQIRYEALRDEARQFLASRPVRALLQDEFGITIPQGES